MIYLAYYFAASILFTAGYCLRAAMESESESAGRFR